MKPYHKIQTVFNRDPETKFKTLLHEDWALPEFEALANHTWLFTEKIDGTNIRVSSDESGKLVIGGRTEKSHVPTHLYQKLSDLFTHSLRESGLNKPNITLYGEGYGNKIQKVGAEYIGDGCDFILFDVQINGLWLMRENVESIAQSLGIKCVPVVGYGTLYDMVDIVNDGFESMISEHPLTAEGIIAIPTGNFLNREGKRIITKLKHKDFR